MAGKGRGRVSIKMIEMYCRLLRGDVYRFRLEMDDIIKKLNEEGSKKVAELVNERFPERKAAAAKLRALDEEMLALRRRQEEERAQIARQIDAAKSELHLVRDFQDVEMFQREARRWCHIDTADQLNAIEKDGDKVARQIQLITEPEQAREILEAYAESCGKLRSNLIKHHGDALKALARRVGQEVRKEKEARKK